MTCFVTNVMLIWPRSHGLSRVHSFLCKFKLINAKQFRFRSNHSTEHALVSFIQTIKHDLDCGIHVYGTFVDLQKQDRS